METAPWQSEERPAPGAHKGKFAPCTAPPDPGSEMPCELQMGKGGGSSLPEGERNDPAKALECPGLRRAPSIMGTQQGANANPSELTVVTVHDLPGGLEARPTGRLDLRGLASAITVP